MRLLGIFRFEFGYQLRRPWPWLYFAAVTVVAVLFVRGNFLATALYDDFFINSPFVIASVTVFAGLFWFVLAGPVAGDAAARDAETGMHPLTYTAPSSRAEYLGGRFLAAFLLNSLILLSVPVGVLLAVHTPGVDEAVVGPFRLAAYLTAFGYIAVPNAFVGTTIQFLSAALSRRAITSYLASVLFYFVIFGGFFLVAFVLERRDLAALLDVFGHMYMTDDLILGWTPIEKSTRLIELEGALLRSRVLWFGIAVGLLAFTYSRFQLAHPTENPWWSRVTRSLGGVRAGRFEAQAPPSGGESASRSVVSVPPARQTFTLATSARQTLAIARTSYWTIAMTRGGIAALAAMALLVIRVMPENLQNLGTPLLPQTGYLLSLLTAPLTNPLTPWVVIPLLTVFYAGELVWRERTAGLGEISDAAPVPDWAIFLGKFLGLSLLLVTWTAFLTIAGLLVQVRMGHHEFEIGLYLKVLFGLQLPDYLLFALLAMVVQGLVNQKYVGHLAALLAYVFIAFAPRIGVRHNLLVYASAPGWSYTDMRGFGPSIEPWLWFKLYWAAWALLLAVVGRLLWMRGMEGRLAVRMDLGRRRLTRATARTAALAVGLILTLGGFIFYNTNVLNEYRTPSDVMERQAEYERRYGRYADLLQPRLTGTVLNVEIFPERREVEVKGTYYLFNGSDEAIDTIHVATIPTVETGGLAFDRTVTRVLADEDRGHHIFALGEPLQPNDSLRLSFEVRYARNGFSNNGIDGAVTERGTFFRNHSLLPAVGYQRGRELMNPAERRKQRLPQRPLIPLLADTEGTRDITGEAARVRDGAQGIRFEAVVGTAEDQIAILPGALRRSWTNRGRRYFHYVAETPIGNEYTFFSARYALREERWSAPPASHEVGPSAGSAQEVAIEVYHVPEHTANLDRMIRSVRKSLEYYSREFGPYPYSYIRLVENPGSGMGAHSDASTIDYTEGFSRFNPAEDPRGLDFPFAIIAHEMAHQWWGAQLPYAYVEGAPLLIESSAWYSALGVVEETYGREHLRRLLRFFREPYPLMPIRQSVPLLRAVDPYAAYRKGPFALYALSEYAGRERVNLAFRRLLESHGSGTSPLATSLDLYRELEGVTPDTLRYLLHDLFAANTYWELATVQATARRTESGSWQVTLRVQARKLTVDPAGIETEVPMDEWVEVGVFAPTGRGADFGETLHLQMHRIRSGEQTITVTVDREPSDAGIDPYHLLIEEDRFDNVEAVAIGR